MHQHFRIRMIRFEHMPSRFEFGSQFAVVVDAPVEDDGDEWFLRLDLAGDDGGVAGLVGQVRAEFFAVVDHRLVPAFVVDDAESSVDQGDVDDGAVVANSSVAESPLPVGASVFDGFVEDVEPGFGDGFQRRWGCAVVGVVDFDDARNAAHGSF